MSGEWGWLRALAADLNRQGDPVDWRAILDGWRDTITGTPT